VLCIKKQKMKDKDGLKREFPCGKCMPCLVTKRQEWTMRLLLEMKLSLFTYFVTLTYSDKNIPERGTLVKKDAQLWMKRLRIDLERNYDKQKIRYFLVGEYGDKKHRPHYHALIFTDRDIPLEYGICPKRRKESVVSSPFHDAWYINDIVDVIPIVGSNSARGLSAYISGYVLKKITKEKALPGLEPEFILSSRGHKTPGGIGFHFVDLLAKMLKSKDVGPVGTDMAFTADLHMIRIDGKLWPLGRYMRTKLIEALGGDQRTDLSKAITNHQRIVEFNEQDNCQELENESAARAKKAYQSYLKARNI
jgi:hypothetical protein